MVSSLLSNAHALKQVIQKYVVDRKSMNGELSKLWLFIKTFAQAIIRYSFELLSDKCQMDLLYIGFQASLVLHNTAKSKYSHYHVQMPWPCIYSPSLGSKAWEHFYFFKPWSQSLVFSVARGLGALKSCIPHQAEQIQHYDEEQDEMEGRWGREWSKYHTVDSTHSKKYFFLILLLSLSSLLLMPPNL